MVRALVVALTFLVMQRGRSLLNGLPVCAIKLWGLDLENLGGPLARSIHISWLLSSHCGPLLTVHPVDAGAYVWKPPGVQETGAYVRPSLQPTHSPADTPMGQRLARSLVSTCKVPSIFDRLSLCLCEGACLQRS